MTRVNATLALIGILIVSNVFTVVEVLGVAHDADRTAAALVANQDSQLRNRTANVKTWCEAINQGRAYDRAFVALAQSKVPVSRRITYALPDLECGVLEAKTMQSAVR